MAKLDNTPHMINNVEALYPRIDKTYCFDTTENRSVPCEPYADGAKYDMSFRMTEPQAKELHMAMNKAYDVKKDKTWGKFNNHFVKEDGDTFIYKTSLKGAYGKDATTPPPQYDSKKNKLPKDFKLTTGSTVNLAVTFVPYKMSKDNIGVSLRLRGVQVIKLAPPTERNPFDTVEDGFDSKSGEEDNPFEVVASMPTKEEVSFDDEPKVVKNDTKPVPQETGSLESIVANWADQG